MQTIAEVAITPSLERSGIEKKSHDGQSKYQNLQQ
jgi:hypothetical protein